MTVSERPDFVLLLKALAVALDADPVDQEREPHYWNELKEYPLSAISSACASLRGSWTASWFPKPANFRKEADLVILAHREYQRGDDGEPIDRRQFHCSTCEDTGWERTTKMSAIYGEDSIPIDAVTVCACRVSNPMWRTRLADGRRANAQKRLAGERV